MEKSKTLFTVSLFALFAVPVWAAGGTYKGWQAPFIWMALISWCFLLAPGRESGAPTLRHRLNGIFRDPAVWASLAFILLLIVQTINTRRMLVFNFSLETWEFTPPPMPELPWSVTRSESFEMLQWFVPVLSCFLLLKHAGEKLNKPLLIWLVLLNGLANAFLAFTHRALGWTFMYNFKEFGKDVYGSFGYPNHGAMFFILMFTLSFGILLKEMLVERSVRHIPTLVVSGILSLVLFLAANLSTSRAGILGVWLVLLGSLVIVSFLGRRSLHPAQKVMGGAVFLGLIGSFIFSFALFAEPVHFNELHNATVGLNIPQEIGARFFQIKSAWNMWLDYPLFGVGGWGYRYFVAQYTPLEYMHMLGVGKANVHNDIMQFLVEFGLFGISCLSGVFFPTFRKRFRELFISPLEGSSLWADPMRIPLICGLSILFGVSLFDLPLRSPAIFMHGILLLMLLEPEKDEDSCWEPLIPWETFDCLETFGKADSHGGSYQMP